MAKDTPIRALMTVLVTAVVCSFFVSASVVLLRPIRPTRARHPAGRCRGPGLVR